MQKTERNISISLIGLLIIFVGAGLLLPSDYEITRQIEIKAGSNRVFNFVNNAEKQQLWSPYRELDSSMFVIIKNVPEGKGAGYLFTSEALGSGELDITHSVRPEMIKTRITFLEHGKAEETWEFHETQGITKVNYKLKGETGFNLPARFMSVFIEFWAGKYLERGLANLKKISEG